MARYNKFNHGIKLNHRIEDGGGEFNYRAYGYVAHMIISATVNVKTHVIRTTKASVSAVSKLTGKAKSIAKCKVNLTIVSILSATPHLIRTTKATVLTVSKLAGKVKNRVRRKVDIVAFSTTTATLHGLRSLKTAITVVSAFAGKATNSVRRKTNIMISTVMNASMMRLRRTNTDINIKSTMAGMARRRMFSEVIAEIISNFIATLRQTYNAVFPRIEFIEYPVELEVKGMPYAGSTVTLKGIFPDSAGNLAELDDVECKVYAPGKRLIATLTPTHVSNGVYSTEYTIPENITGQFDFEFRGTLGNKQIVGRSSFQSLWR